MIDLLAYIPLIIHYFSNSYNEGETITIEKTLLILFFLKFNNYTSIIKKIKEKFYKKRWVNHVISLISLFINVVFIAHLFSCIWLLTAKYEI